MRRTRLLRVDMHTHPNMSKRLPFEGGSIDRMVTMARQARLDGIAMTEHLHCPSYWAVYDQLARNASIAGGVFWLKGVAIVPGGEINVREGAHVVVLGEVNELRRLDLAFPRPLSSGYEPRLEELLDVSGGYDVVRIGAHMFRPHKELGKFDDTLLGRFDAIEVNGKDFGTEERLLDRAAELGLPIVAGSDAHHWLQIGVRHTIVYAAELGLRPLLNAIRSGRTWFDAGALTPLRVRAAKSWKTFNKGAAGVPSGVPTTRTPGQSFLDAGARWYARARAAAGSA